MKVHESHPCVFQPAAEVAVHWLEEFFGKWRKSEVGSRREDRKRIEVAYATFASRESSQMK